MHRDCRAALIWSVAVAAGVAACGGQKSADTRSDTTPPPAAPVVTPQIRESNAQEPAKFVLDHVSDLRRGGQTLGEWKRLHAGDVVELHAPHMTEQTNENWCARATSEIPLDADRMSMRTVYFYLPPQPDPPVLPSTTDAQTLIDQCRLGFVWTEVDSADPARADALSEVVTQEISAELGPVESNADLFWWDAGKWKRKGLWQQVGVSVATAVTQRPGWRDSDDPKPNNRLLMIAAGDASKINLRYERSAPGAAMEACYARHREEMSRIDQALAIAAPAGAVDEAIRAAIKIVSVRDGCTDSPTAAERTAIFNAIVPWLDAASTMPQARQAAAFFVADQLLAGSAGPEWRRGESPPIRRSLERLGAKFAWSPLGASYVYTHAWLRRALMLDPDGPAGELAFLTLMEHGFETSGMCTDQHGEGFRAVIAEGDAYLRRKPDSRFRDDVHLLMAQAYADIVTLAAGGGYEESESARAKYKAEAPAARANAITHFRTAYASSSRSARARDVWPDAWRLVAGLPPRATRFYCIYD